MSAVFIACVPIKMLSKILRAKFFYFSSGKAMSINDDKIAARSYRAKHSNCNSVLRIGQFFETVFCQLLLFNIQFHKNEFTDW